MFKRIKFRKRTLSNEKSKAKPLSIDNEISTLFRNNNSLRKQYFLRNSASDILNVHGLNKPEFPPREKSPFTNKKNLSTCEFTQWENIYPHLDPEIHIKELTHLKSQILNSKYTITNNNRLTFKERLFTEVPKTFINLPTSINKNYSFFGDYPGEEFKIKKIKPKTFVPEKIIKTNKITPYERKLKYIFGDMENSYNEKNEEIKPALRRHVRFSHSNSMGIIAKEFSVNNSYDKKITNNCKEMKYFLFYGSKGIENANKKLTNLYVTSSTDNLFQYGKTPLQNKINSLKSNIFNEDEKDENNKINNDVSNNNNNNNKKVIKVKRKKSYQRSKRKKSIVTLSNYNKNKIFENHTKKNSFYENYMKLQQKPNLVNSKTNLYFQPRKNEDIFKLKREETKTKSISISNPSPHKKKYISQNDTRKDIEKTAKNYYQESLNVSKLKKFSSDVSQFQGSKFINDYFSKKNKIQNEEESTYEVKTKLKGSSLDNKYIEKKFAEKGLHIYNLKEDINSLMGNKEKGNLSFIIKNNPYDLNFDNKINDIKNDLFKNKGTILQKLNGRKKNKIDIIPNTIEWYNANSSLATKHINAEKSRQGKIHSKPLSLNKDEEKITRIRVNLKYKNGPFCSFYRF